MIGRRADDLEPGDRIRFDAEGDAWVVTKTELAPNDRIKVTITAPDCADLAVTLRRRDRVILENPAQNYAEADPEPGNVEADFTGGF